MPRHSFRSPSAMPSPSTMHRKCCQVVGPQFSIDTMFAEKGARAQNNKRLRLGFADGFLYESYMSPLDNDFQSLYQT